MFKFLFKKIDDIANCFSTKINHKIENILGNIGVMHIKFFLLHRHFKKLSFLTSECGYAQ